MAREVKALTRVMEAPREGLVSILGGAKVSDKIEVLRSLIPRSERVIIGGAMAYTFLAAQGYSMGTSRVEAEQLETALELIELSKERGTQLLLPVDHRCASAFAEDAELKVSEGRSIPDGYMGLDVGPDSERLFAEAIDGAQTVIWNGPMGVFEWERFKSGTMRVAEAVASCSGYTLIGGGDSARAANESGFASQIKHISTGGGASLEFLEGKTLPGVAAILERHKALSEQGT